jgi:HlyD family secretion protein
LDGKPVAVAIRLGISDGTSTEVVGGELKEGQEVLVGTLAAGGAATRSSAPPSQTQTSPRMRL